MDLEKPLSQPEGPIATFEPELGKSESPTVGEGVSWTEKEERVIRWKLDAYLMPLLIIGFFVLQLDRSNISNALTDTITEDLRITTDQVNTGTQLMSAGIVIAEIPSNLLLQRFGASVWLTFLLSTWGAVALGQAYVTNIHSFYATRFLLGIFEGGYIPGAQYMLALFYKENELAMRTAVFYFGNYFSTATGSLIAAGILQMAGMHGLAGWQWLFLIEGALTLAAFVLFVVFIPSSPARTKPIHGLFDVFSDRDREIMLARVLADDKSKGAAKAAITWREFLKATCDFRLWLHLILNVVALSPKGGLQLYGPTIITSLGFGKTKANLLNSVSSYIVVVLSFLISLASDKTGLRGPCCIVASVWSIAFGGALLGIGVNSDKWLRYAMFTLLSSGNALAQGLNDAWLNINARSPVKRSIGLAFVVMGSNIGGIVGPSLFQASDKPAYVHGFAAVLGLYGASIVLILVLMAVYWNDNRKISCRQEDGSEVAEAKRLYQI